MFMQYRYSIGIKINRRCRKAYAKIFLVIFSDHVASDSISICVHNIEIK